jgi:hypothetical protein
MFAAGTGTDNWKPKLIASHLATITLPIMCNQPSHSTNPALTNRRQFRGMNFLQKFFNTFEEFFGLGAASASESSLDTPE